MPEPPQIVVVGSHAPGLFIRVDHPPLAGETTIGWDLLEPIDGGKGSNQAIATIRLGATVSFVGCVGQDRLGDEGERWMRDAGVDTTWLQRSGTCSTGVGFVMLNAQGVPAMVTCMGANAEVSEEMIDGALHDLKGAAVLMTQFEIPPDVALYAARAARRQGMIALVNPAPAIRVSGLEAATILTPNEIEAKMLLGLPPHQEVKAEELARQLRIQTGVEQVVVTMGKRGVVGADASGEWFVSAPRVEALDSSGAGDVFCAALGVGLAEGKTVRTATQWACAAASLSVTKHGTILSFPTRAEADGYATICGLG